MMLTSLANVFSNLFKWLSLAYRSSLHSALGHGSFWIFSKRVSQGSV